MSSPGTNLERYSRQVRFAPIGAAGQQRLGDSTVLVLGCGALGSAIANTLVRSGVGTVRIVDRDFVEESNLQRQLLFDEADAAAGAPKAIAAAEKLRAINSQITIEPHVADVTRHNLPQLAAGVQLIIDGTDNFETRLLLNDYAVREGVPWIYGGVVGAEGQVLVVLPGESACFACLLPEPPAPGETQTCDTTGVLGPAVSMIAALQCIEALKILTGAMDAVTRELIVVDLWPVRFRTLTLSPNTGAEGCRVCQHHQFDWLTGQRGGEPVFLCGRNAVQISPSAPQQVDLARIASQLASVGAVTQNAHLVRLSLSKQQLTLFADGRVIVSGVDEVAEARKLVTQYLGI
jgi:adenylyltransferase/sulfurtransferase